MDANSLNVVTLQPFYGGSHQAFIDGWIQHSRHNWQLFSMPDRSWKWRMRYSAIGLAEQVNAFHRQGHSIDVLLSSDMMNVAEFKGLLAPELRSIPFVLYFHENQFAYPTPKDKQPDLQFGRINFLSALAADEVWFNSEHNRSTFMHHLATVARRWPEMNPGRLFESLNEKSSIQFPGIELREIKNAETNPDRPIHLIWAARWEHDKNPQGLLLILDRLAQLGVDFQISVIGPSFHTVPRSIETIQAKYSSQIVHWGYLTNREEYWNALADADILLSTANHEFFGLSVAEAASLGTYVLLPDRLSYPELLAVEQNPEFRTHLYDGTPHDAAVKIKQLSHDKSPFQACTLADHFRMSYGWQTRAEAMDTRLNQIGIS